MAETLTISLSAFVTRQFTYQAHEGGSTADDGNPFGIQDSWTRGNGDSQVDEVVHERYTLGPGGAILLDVYGTLTDPFGNPVRMEYVKAVLVKHCNTLGSVSVGGGSNAITSFWGTPGDGINVYGDGMVMLWAPNDGYAVTSGTAENLQILHNSDTDADITVEVLILGVSP